MKTRARVSFIIDLDKINSKRKLNGKTPLTESEFFQLVSDKSATLFASTDKGSIAVDVELGYIVI